MACLEMDKKHKCIDFFQLKGTSEEKKVTLDAVKPHT